MFSKWLSLSSFFTLENEDGIEDVEQLQRLEQWKFYVDDALLFGPESTEEHDKALIDEYDTKYESSWFVIY